MSQLVLESENEQNLKLIQELAEKLNIHCRFILQKTKSKRGNQNAKADTSPVSYGDGLKQELNLTLEKRNIISELLNNPLKIANPKPFNREEIYASRED